ncbi:condensation domain-containing protein, partial [Nonomuraea lactucae]|uniref:condensation domain-containing protein n=1 Tax=Nonomuraea lactucae TaxID=2249762 RepID=UPI001F0652EE
MVFFDRGEEPGWLGVVVHHLVMDGVSWNILLEDLDRAYRGERLPAKTTSFRQWAEALRGYAGSDVVRAQLPYWLEQAGSGFVVPVDGRVGAVDGVVRVELDVETTAALLTRAHRAYRTQINDLLLAALLQTLGGWAGTSAVTIGLESHGREAVVEGVDLSRTVGWFTSVFPVVLAAADLGDAAVVVKSVKEGLRRSPGRGVGFGVLRYLADGGDELVGRLCAVAEPHVGFNYLGGRAGMSGGLLVGELAAGLAGPDGQTRAHKLQVEAFRAVDGRLVFEWHYGGAWHRGETIERVAVAYVEALRALVEHCLSPEAGGFTPSDFPLARLDQPTLDAVAAGARVADVYPLTSVQQGILFH